MNKTYLRGDMYYADLGRGIGSEQEGYRPVLIYSERYWKQAQPHGHCGSHIQQSGRQGQAAHSLPSQSRERPGAAFSGADGAAPHH